MSDHTPVRHSEARAVLENPSGSDEALIALRTVLLYTITDALGLVVEESMWAGFHLEETLAVLGGKAPHMVPLAVRQEMLEGNYTQALEKIERQDNRTAGANYDPAVTHADLGDWAGVIMSMVKSCYTLRPMDESIMQGAITGLLRELGVGDPKNPRSARYLPNDVRHRLAQKDIGQ